MLNRSVDLFPIVAKGKRTYQRAGQRTCRAEPEGKCRSPAYRPPGGDKHGQKVPERSGCQHHANGITVDVTTSIGPVDFSSPFDVAIRRDPAHFCGLKSLPFLHESSLLVCSRAYLRNRPLISPDNLRGHIKIEIRAREDLWKSWHSHFPDDQHDDTQTLTLDHTFAAIQAAEDGLGIVVIPWLFCARHLASGRLVSPFADRLISTGVYSLLLRDREDEAVKKFASWLSAFNL